MFQLGERMRRKVFLEWTGTFSPSRTILVELEELCKSFIHPPLSPSSQPPPPLPQLKQQQQPLLFRQHQQMQGSISDNSRPALQKKRKKPQKKVVCQVTNKRVAFRLISPCRLWLQCDLKK